MSNIQAARNAALSLEFPRPVLEFNPILTGLFKRCTPRILVVADGGLDFSDADFGLSTFVETLKSSQIYGMTPIVDTAHRSGGSADTQNFTFTTDTLSAQRYDVLFLFGIAPAPAMPQAELDVIIEFMNAGGGVFGTGDHEELGKALCGRVPRLRSMRYWSEPEVPSFGGTDRLSTNDPGVDDTFAFNDQSDPIPQKIYPAYAGTAGDTYPHPLLQHPTKAIIEVLPDHPHEGECVVPGDLTTTYDSAGAAHAEWPDDPDGNPVGPELVAKSMSYGGAFPGKAAIAPREFGAICAYDGHRAGVGRVSTDATWHHFVNINLVASGAGPGLAANPDAFERVQTYYRNIASWLMPKNARLCLNWGILIRIKDLFPLLEILPEFPPRPRPQPDPPPIEVFLRLGGELRAGLRSYFTRAAVEQLEQDLLEVAGPQAARGLARLEARLDGTPLGRAVAPRDLVTRVATGAIVLAVEHAIPAGCDIRSAFERSGHEAGLTKIAEEAVASALKSVAGALKEGHGALEELADQLC